jgi:hypothetical protein
MPTDPSNVAINGLCGNFSLGWGLGDGTSESVVTTQNEVNQYGDSCKYPHKFPINNITKWSCRLTVRTCSNPSEASFFFLPLLSFCYLYFFSLHRITSHRIASHHITSHCITSHHITSHHITSHHITSHHITSHHITSHHITSRHVTSHHITSHHITSHIIITYLN